MPIEKLAFFAVCKHFSSMTASWKKGNTGWFIGGGIVALLMILLAESSTSPRDEAITTDKNTIQKDFRLVLKNIKTIPGDLPDKETKHRILLAKRLPGIPEPTDGPMATLSQMEEVRTNYLDALDLSVIEVPARWDADWLLEIIQRDPSVKYAEVEPRVEKILHAQPSRIIPNDPGFGRQTNLHDPSRGVDIDAPEAWAYTTGSDHVIVAVHDSGIDLNSTDLRPNLWVNEAEREGEEGVDDDNNGCIDDIHGCDLPIMGNGHGNIQDDHINSHGTLVSSILGARGNNNYGITGVAWNVRIMSVRGSFLPVVNHILNMRNRGVNIRVINLSGSFLLFGEGNCIRSQTWYNAARNLGAAGVLYVNSAGNSGYFSTLAEAHTPACYDLDNIIVVGGQAKRSRTRSSLSAFGSAVVDLVAPGDSLPALRVGDEITEDENSGTSGAAPHVAGAAALLWSFKPDLTVSEVRSALLNTVDRFPAFEGAVASGGALNIANALYSVAEPGIRIHSSQTTVAEENSGYLDLSLTREPARPSSGQLVVLRGRARAFGDAAVRVAPQTLIFSSANWHIPQRMNVHASGAADGETILLEVSVEPAYAPADYRAISVTATFTATESTGSLTIPRRITEGETATGIIRFSNPAAATTTLSIAAAGTASAGEDYTPPNAAVTIGAGSTRTTLTIPTLEDEHSEPEETIVLRIAAADSAILPATLHATITIEDNDLPVMTLSLSPDTIRESNESISGQMATVTISLDHPAAAGLPFTLRTTPTAAANHLRTNGHELWQTHGVMPAGTTRTRLAIYSFDEEDITQPRRVTLSLEPGAGFALHGTPSMAQLTILDNYVSVATLRVEPDTIVQTNDLRTAQTATFTVAFDRPVVFPVELEVRPVNPSGSYAEDIYEFPGRFFPRAPDYLRPHFQISEGATSFQQSIYALDHDDLPEPSRQITLRLFGGTIHNPLTIGAPREVVLTILDDDAPVITLALSTGTLIQGAPGEAPTATATVMLDRPAVADVPFFLDAGSVYRHDTSHMMNHLSGNVWPTSATIATGATSTEIIIHSIDEDDEPEIFRRITLSLDISPNTAARLGTPHRATLRVWDDDGNLGLYLRLRVFMEGAMITDTTTIQTDP